MTTGDNLFISFLKEKSGKTLNMEVGELGSIPSLITNVLDVPFGFPNHHLDLLGRLCETMGKESGGSGPEPPFSEPQFPCI